VRALGLGFALLAGAGCAGRALEADGVCDGPGCAFSPAEWARVSTLSPLPPVPADSSNRYRDRTDAAMLGGAFFFDARFAGPATQVNALGNPSVPARAPRGGPTGVSCATCHDQQRGGVDVTSYPGNVSAGAGWTDVNALPTVNSAYNHAWFRNGRADSGWALAATVAESATTMNGNRLRPLPGRARRQHARLPLVRRLPD
jgi:cytochrome c peroxidase